MTRSRDEHLAWCKSRALAILDAGDHSGAVASMISDLQKWREPLYDPFIFKFLATMGLMHSIPIGPEAVRHWIEGFA